MGIERRAFALIFFLAALPLCLSTAVGAGVQRASLAAMSRARLLSDARNPGAAVEGWMEDRRRLAEVLAGYPGLADLPPADQRRLLTGAMERYPGILTVSLIGADGRQRVRSDGKPLQDLRDRAYFQEAARGGAALEMVLRRADGQASLVVAVPVAEPAVPAAARQVLILSTDLTRLCDLVGGVDLPGGGALVLDAAGRVMAHADRTRLMDEASRHGLTPGAAAEGRLSYVDDHGQAWTGAVAALPYGVRVVVQQPEGAPDAVSLARAVPPLLSAALLVLIGILARRLSRRLVAPLRAPPAPAPPE